MYNADKDPIFARFINTILHQKMSEVCSTTLPQMAIPRIMTHPEYKNYLRERTQHYEKLSAIAYGILKDVPFLIANKTNGAFYNTVIFNESVLNDRQSLPIKQPEIKKYVEELTKGTIEYDKRFVYYLLAATGFPSEQLTAAAQGVTMKATKSDSTMARLAPTGMGFVCDHEPPDKGHGQDRGDDRERGQDGGFPTSDTAANVARTRPSRLSFLRCLSIFSTTTMASSTRIPMEKIRAKSVTRFGCRP